MRALSFILSFYMLALAVYPCLDIEPETEPDSYLVQIEEKHIDTPSSEHEEEHDEGHCSPFCMCHCCHTHIVIGDLPYFSSVPIQSPIQGFLSILRTDEIVRPFLRPPIAA